MVTTRFRTVLAQFRDSALRLRGLARHPERFTDYRGAGFFFKSLSDAALAWLSIALVLFLITALNLHRIREAQEAMRAFIPSRVATGSLLPWSQLLFPVFWFTASLMTGAIRHAFLIILGEPGRSLEQTQALTVYAFLPLAALTGLSAIIDAAFPCVPLPGAGILACPSVITGGLLVLGGLLSEAYLTVSGLRLLYGQNRGRAILTWTSPFLFITLLAILSSLLLVIAMLFR